MMWKKMAKLKMVTEVPMTKTWNTYGTYDMCAKMTDPAR